MNTQTKIIIYDDTCPLCAGYTNAFIKTGFIAKENRKNFNNIAPAVLAKIDTNKCRNEIPLIDNKTNEVWYGIDALLEILNQKIPFVKQIGNLKPVKSFLCKLYKFISYNRRVITATSTRTGHFDCTPDFNMPYRIIFMAVFLVFNTLMLYPLQEHVLSESIFSKAGISRLESGHITLVTINIIIAFQVAEKDAVEYLGQVNMLALVSILLNIPLMLVNKYLHLNNNLITNIYLCGLGLFICREYIRRMNYANIIAKHPSIVIANVISIVAFLLYLVF